MIYQSVQNIMLLGTLRGECVELLCCSSTIQNQVNRVVIVILIHAAELRGVTLFIGFSSWWNMALYAILANDFLNREPLDEFE